MIVNSPLELYTIYLGWHQYDAIWDACKEFGLAFLPFLGLFFENLTTPFESEFGRGTETSFRRVFIEFIVMMIVIMLVVDPAVSLKASEVKYKPYCARNAIESTVGNSGTSYDDVFQHLIVGSDVKVPLLFQLVMDWSSGFTNALIVGTIPCDTNVNEMMQGIITTHLPDKLRNQIERFNNECYIKARSSFDSQRPDPSSYQQTLKEYGGETDLSWMGSHVLRQLYYKDITPSGSVEGFPYNTFPSTYVDDAIKKGEMQKPKWGYPSCEQWWGDQQLGLEKQIVENADKQSPQNSHLGELPLSDRVSNWLHEIHLPFGTRLTNDDVIARTTLYPSAHGFGGFNTNVSTINTNGSLPGDIAKPMTEFYQTFKRYTETPFARASMSDFLPIVQAIGFFFLIMFMPFILIFGRYRLSVFMSLSFILFSLTFMNYIWMMLNYLETALMNSLIDPLSGNILGQNASLVNFINTMYYGAPLLLLTLMGMAGIKIGSGLDNLMRNTQGKTDDAAKSSLPIASIVTKFL